MQAGSGSVIQRMCQRDFRLNPGEPESIERKRFEKRRTGGKRMNGGTNIMHESWQRQLRRTRAATDCRICLQNQHRTVAARQRDCRSQTIWSGANYDRVIVNRHGSGSRGLPQVFPPKLKVRFPAVRKLAVLSEELNLDLQIARCCGMNSRLAPAVGF